MVLKISLENLNFPYYYEHKFSKKYSSSVDVIQKLELPRFSRADNIKQFSWSDSKTWTTPIITSWNFAKIKKFCRSDSKTWIERIIRSSNFIKNKVVLLKWFENLNCPYYQALTFSTKAVLLKWFENLNWAYYHALKFFKE